MPKFLFGCGDISLAADACRGMRSSLSWQAGAKCRIEHHLLPSVNQPRRYAKSLYNAQSV
jgi:hypothetical protein